MAISQRQLKMLAKALLGENKPKEKLSPIEFWKKNAKYKDMSYSEIGDVKVSWTNKENEVIEKTYPAIKWENGQVAVFKNGGSVLKGVIPADNGDYTWKGFGN